MTTRRTLRTGALACTLFFAITFSALAQSDAARLQGVVADSSGAIVPGADVTLTDQSTNRVLNASTGAATGAFSFPTLPPGNYQLEISKTGFKTIKRQITLQVAQVANINFSLAPGAVNESVTVGGELGLVDSATSDMGFAVQSKQIEDLPLNGRNFTELATLIPGVSRGVPGNIATGSVGRSPLSCLESLQPIREPWLP